MRPRAEGGAELPDLPTPEIPSLAAARTSLLEIISDRSSINPAGVRLTQVGADFSKRMSLPFEAYVASAALLREENVPPEKRKMRQFIEAYCSAEIELSPDKSGNPSARLKLAPSANVEKFAAQPSSSEFNVRYKKGVFLAFVRPLTAGLSRFINLGEKPGFTDIRGDHPPEKDWIMVESEFIAAIPITAAIDVPSVISRLKLWQVKHSIKEKDLIETSRPFIPKSRLDVFVSLIEKLPEHIISNWQVPASVLKALSEE